MTAILGAWHRALHASVHERALRSGSLKTSKSLLNVYSSLFFAGLSAETDKYNAHLDLTRVIAIQTGECLQIEGLPLCIFTAVACQ